YDVCRLEYDLFSGCISFRGCADTFSLHCNCSDCQWQKSNRSSVGESRRPGVDRAFASALPHIQHPTRDSITVYSDEITHAEKSSSRALYKTERFGCGNVCFCGMGYATHLRCILRNHRAQRQNGKSL